MCIAGTQNRKGCPSDEGLQRIKVKRPDFQLGSVPHNLGAETAAAASGINTRSGDCFSTQLTMGRTMLGGV